MCLFNVDCNLGPIIIPRDLQEEESVPLAELPPQRLQHLRELVYCDTRLDYEHCAYLKSPPFPVSWSQLTALSSLRCDLNDGYSSIFPSVLSLLTSLKTVEITTNRKDWRSEVDPNDMELSTHGLNLTSLIIDGEELA